MYQDFTYKTPGTFISPPWEKGRRRWENHHGVPSCLLLCLRAFVLGSIGVLPAATLTLSKHKFFASEKASLLDAKNL